MNPKKIIRVEKYEQEQNNIITKTQELIDKKGKIILGVSIAIIVVTALLFHFRSVAADSEIEDRKNASTAISRILPLLQSDQLQMALDGNPNYQIRGEQVIGLIDIVKKYDGSDQAYLAAFYAGGVYMKLNDIVNAEKYFDISLNSDSEIVKEGTYAGLGKIFEIKEDFGKAAELYENASDNAVSDESKGRFFVNSAICFEKAGNTEKAGLLYKEILSIKNSNFEGIAKSALLRLGMKFE